MSLAQEIDKLLRSLNDWMDRVEGKPPKQRPKPRYLDDEDVSGWFDAADERESRPPTSLTRRQMQDYLRAKNPVRWRRLQKDFAWAQKMVLKAGQNPEDTRWLL